jgi:signal transduction histidine kinase
MVPEVAAALLDAKGRLIRADEPLAGLNDRAGGAPGLPLAVPRLAVIARAAQRLGVAVARGVTVGDREGDVELFVRAEPLDGGVRLSVTDWHERRRVPVAENRAPELLAAEADWRWECDAGLRLRFVSIEAGVRLGFDAIGGVGRPLTELFTLQPDAGGAMPLLDALARRRSFAGQPATLRSGGLALTLSGVARRGADGAFAGFAGGVVAAAPAPPEPPAAPAMGERLERALRGPLRQIIANADSINAGAEGPVGPDYAGYAADIASAGRHLMALVDDLADLEAVERPDFALPVEPIDLADLARRAAGLLAVRAANAEVAVLRLDPAVRAPALGEFRRTLQILVNLLGNALRYAPRGSSVEVIAGPGPHVTVADRGKGIAVADQARIFDKFERVDPREPGGSGLGLYIARRLARAMGGDLTVESAPGEGALFTLRLPPDPASDQHQ